MIAFCAAGQILTYEYPSTAFTHHVPARPPLGRQRAIRRPRPEFCNRPVVAVTKVVPRPGPRSSVLVASSP